MVVDHEQGRVSFCLNLDKEHDERFELPHYPCQTAVGAGTSSIQRLQFKEMLDFRAFHADGGSWRFAGCLFAVSLGEASVSIQGTPSERGASERGASERRILERTATLYASRSNALTLRRSDAQTPSAWSFRQGRRWLTKDKSSYRVTLIASASCPGLTESELFLGFVSWLFNRPFWRSLISQRRQQVAAQRVAGREPRPEQAVQEHGGEGQGE